jgi:hypothetical protein
VKRSWNRFGSLGMSDKVVARYQESVAEALKVLEPVLRMLLNRMARLLCTCRREPQFGILLHM